MKKILLLVFVLCFSVSQAQTLILNENFDYGTAPNASILAVTTNWVNHSGTQNPPYAYPGLSYSNYPSSNIGGAINFSFGSSSTGNDGDVNRTFTDITTTSTIYVAFLVNLSAAKSTADYFFHLGQNPFSTSTFRGKVFAVASGSGWNIGVTKQGTNAPIMNTTTTLNFGQTYLCVIKYDFNATALTDDVVSLFVYSSSVPTSESGPTLLSITNVNDGVNDPADIGSVAVRQGSNTPTGTVDGIRVSNNWGLAVTGTATGVEENISTLPTKFNLSQNYPNPFNPSTVIKYQVPQGSFVNISVYDILGNKISTLVNQDKAAGTYETRFDASNLPSGIYFYTIQTGSFSQTKKMMLMK
ncbi:MAG: T9SS type A sorting domain-containing protein [Ignavibacteriales bacterium]|nr:T9SS type A sorting domain-containing protein [Ignavibacteriales bacterium]